jgi:hypothetical protein
MEFIKINNRKNFLLSEVPVINPYSRKYTTWWKEDKKRCIEGLWSVDDENINLDIKEVTPDENIKSNKWRWIPPNTYFYVNHGHIYKNIKGTTSGAKRIGRPDLDDIEWEFGYNWIEARGFSGFEFDDRFSCNRFLLEKDYTNEDLLRRCMDENGEIIDLLWSNYFRSNGERKEYVPAREYLRRYFNKPMGRPIYGNIPKNLMILGTRDGGKSYLVANQTILHELIFDGLRYYDKANPLQNSSAEIVVGASISDKSRDLLSKVKLSMDELPGGWKKGTSEEIRSPYFKHMSGSLTPNKEWYHMYRKKVGGDWKDVGTNSKIKHRIFTTENPEAAAGGRPGTIVVEEVGLVGNILSIHASNDAAQNDGGEKFGSSLYIGTAGNMEKIIEAELIFNDPKGFDFLEFNNDWEDGGKICWFIPATYMARKFKDGNGNTIVESALKHFEKRRKNKKKAASKKALDGELMNYPLKPSEMFISKSNSKFNIHDTKVRIKDLLSGNNNELKLSLKGYYEIDGESGVPKFRIDKNARPVTEFPLKKGSGSIEGCIEIFETPIKNAEGFVPSNIYAAALDPVDDDDNNKVSSSLQSTFIINLLTDRIVAEYTGRTKFAKDYYEQVRRMLIDYNATLLYENQKKGVFTHFDQKNSLYLLEDTPHALRDIDLQKGSSVGNKGKGIYATDKINYWGQQDLLPGYLDKQAYNREPGVTNIQIFKSLGALREMLFYDGKINTDRISSLGLLMISRELKLKHKTDINKKRKRLSDDPFFNRHNDVMRNRRIPFLDEYGKIIN